MRRPLVLLPLTLLVACGEAPSATSDSPPPEPTLAAEGKADVADRVAMLGALTFGTTVDGAFTEDLQFDGWTLSTRAGARLMLEVTRTGTSSKLNSTLFVYGPKTPAGYGTASLARDDDSGWGPHARLRDLTLAAAGEYLVVVGTHDGAGRGRYRLAATCASGDCAPPVVPAPTACPAPLAAGLLQCTIDQAMDEGLEPKMRPTPEEGLATCLDAEAFAGPYDAACAAEPGAWCALPYEDAWRLLSPLCGDALAPTIRRTTCTFGDAWRALERTPGIAATRERTARQVSHFVGLERQQVVAAMVAAGHTDVSTPAEALARADSNEIYLVDLWDESRGAPFLGIEFGAGDTSVGAIFPQDSATPVVRNSDGDFYECTLAPGPRGRDCRAAADCADGLTCQGTSPASGVGRCVTPGACAGEGEACSLSQGCGLDTGLICAGLTRAPQDGLCLPAWMRSTFYAAPEAPLTLAAREGGGTLEIPIDVRGLATVDMDVWLEVIVLPEAATPLTARLTNPAGATVTLFEGRSDQRWLASPVMGFSGDEAVNGTWTLTLTDAGGVGLTIEDHALTIASRWD